MYVHTHTPYGICILLHIYIHAFSITYICLYTHTILLNICPVVRIRMRVHTHILYCGHCAACMFVHIYTYGWVRIAYDSLCIYVCMFILYTHISCHVYIHTCISHMYIYIYLYILHIQMLTADTHIFCDITCYCPHGGGCVCINICTRVCPRACIPYCIYLWILYISILLCLFLCRTLTDTGMMACQGAS